MELTQHQKDSIYKYAMRSLLAGKGRDMLVEELIKRTVPEDIAVQIVDQALKKKRSNFRRQGVRELFQGVAFLISAMIIAGATIGFDESAAKTVITLGLYVLGGLFFVKGLYRVIFG